MTLGERRGVGTPQPRQSFDRQVDAYLDGLDPSSSYSSFVAWFEAVVREAQNERVSGVASPHRPQQLLDAVRQAIDIVLAPSGWRRLDWDFIASEVVAEHEESGRLPVSLLSDGIRNLIAMVADLAHRCARLNPHLGAAAARETPGIVLIDEVDMHLHPGWQQTLLDGLSAAFGQVQFIVTTHSPQVLSAVNAESIRIIELHDGVGVARAPRQQTRGVVSADVLASVMAVDPIPDVFEWQELQRYHALIEDGAWEGEEASGLRVRLEEHYGSAHPVILDCDRLIRFQALRLRRQASEAREGGA